MKSEQKYSVETPMSLSFEAKAEGGLLKIELVEEQGESSILIGDYTIYRDGDGDFIELYRYDGAKDEQNEVGGEEREKILSAYEQIIAEAETELAEQIKSIICESLEGKFFARKLHILDKQCYDANKSSFYGIYKVSNNLGVYITSEDRHLRKIPTVDGLIIYDEDEIAQKLELEVVPEIEGMGAQGTLEQYIEDGKEESYDDLEAFFVKIITDETIIDLFLDEDEFYFEGEKIEHWRPDIGCADNAYIIR